jgi:uncharacterized protein (TIGR02996 family)
MLVISRKKNESLILGDGIVVSVIEIRGDKVRLGIDAPREMPVYRSPPFSPPRWYAPETPSCPEEEHCLTAIDDNPRDVELLQVYADWLEERGDSRSALIREQCRYL